MLKRFRKTKKPPTTLLGRQIHNFKQRKTAYYSFIILMILVVLSVGAELVANSKPYFVARDGNVYFPMLVNYPSSEFGVEGFSPDFREVCKQESATCL
jgi:microcin C transport system permease protein